MEYIVPDGPSRLGVDPVDRRRQSQYGTELRTVIHGQVRVPQLGDIPC